MSNDDGTVVLHISEWSSRCGACGESCDPYSETHDVVLGYGSRNGSPGCGARFSAVASDYGDEKALRRMRPDLPICGSTGGAVNANANGRLVVDPCPRVGVEVTPTQQ